MSPASPTADSRDEGEGEGIVPQAEIYDLSTAGRDAGVGTFASATVTRVVGGYHLRGGDREGRWFATFLDAVYVDSQECPDLNLHEQLDASGLEFRSGGGELDLRRPERAGEEGV